MLACVESDSSSATARAQWVLKLFGEVRTEAVAKLSASCQSELRNQVRIPNAATIMHSVIGASNVNRVRSPIAKTIITAHAANPTDGKYRNRSAMIVPV